MNQELIDASKKLFFKKIGDHKEDRWNLLVHVPEAEKWAKKILKKYPDANKEVILLSVWLHDIGHYPITDEDHALVSERIARIFLLKEKADDNLIKDVLHCIRSHRNRDVAPKTLEAKLFAMIDSASHFTHVPYIDMATHGLLKEAFEKLERDYRDIKPFPEILHEVTPLYHAIKKLLLELKKIELK